MDIVNDQIQNTINGAQFLYNLTHQSYSSSHLKWVESSESQATLDIQAHYYADLYSFHLTNILE